MTLLALLAMILALGAKRGNEARPLDLSSAVGAQSVSAVRNKKSELMLFNFRAVEDGRLYRSSGFPRNRTGIEKGKTQKRAAAFADEQLFNWLRARKIRTVVSLEEADYFYGEQGYFDWWNKRSDTKIKVIHLPVAEERAYYGSLKGGLRASVEFLEIMKKHRPSDGAVLIHCDTGKDRTGVVVAAYELWRNAGKTDEETLWRQVRERYLASNTVIGKDKTAAQFAGGQQTCSDNSKGFVCGSNLDSVRSDLKLIAQL